MPNGRSGGFFLEPAKLQQLLTELNDDAVVGNTTGASVTATEMSRELSEWRGEKVLIEEQDHSWYIVHLPEWVTVGEGSPLLGRFREAHAEFLRELESGEKS
jgi:hypothetical protein